MDVPFHYIDLRAFCFATEVESRVETAIRTFLPDSFEIDQEVTTGYHGDEIRVLSTRVENNDDMREVFAHVLDLDNVTSVRDEVGERVDENCSFYLQFDKQAAYTGEVRLGRGVMLRAKVEVYPANQDKAIDVVKEALIQ